MEAAALVTPQVSFQERSPESSTKPVSVAERRLQPQPPMTRTRANHYAQVSTNTRVFLLLLQLLMHILSLLVYLIPVVFQSRQSAHHALINSRRSGRGRKKSRLQDDDRGLIMFHSRYTSAAPTLDEAHIMDVHDNIDIHGNRYIKDERGKQELDGSRWASFWHRQEWYYNYQHIFSNDYWGRPMNSPSSHKSWRPLTVLSFRWTQQALNRIVNTGKRDTTTIQTHSGGILDALTLHRIISIVTHGAIGECLAILATKLLLPQIASTTQLPLLYEWWVVYIVAKLLWMIHPTHVEVVVNVANRSHLLAVMCSVLLSDPDAMAWYATPLPLAAGFLCSETFLFQIPAALVTCMAILYLRRYHVDPADPSHSLWQQFLNTASGGGLAYRIILYPLSGVAYYGLRKYFDTLSIPVGLIRPAENPFYTLTGWTRVYSYSYTVAIHILKAFDVDIVGFSHEYGFACITPISQWLNYDDLRLLLPILLVMLFVAVFTIYFIRDIVLSKPAYRLISPGFIHYIFLLSWLVLPLFPISGVVRVGTFISDRIVVPTTVGTCMVMTVAFCFYIRSRPSPHKPTAQAYSARLASSSKSDDRSCSNPNTPPTDDRDTSNDGTDAEDSLLSSLLLHSRLPLRKRATRSPQRNGHKADGYLAISHHDQRRYVRIAVLLIAIVGYGWYRIHYRSIDWMDSVSLLQSSLRTCPNFAKGHLELSKVYSGLYPSLYNLTKSRLHLDQARHIDPTYCDIHMQFAHVAIQEQTYHEFEYEQTMAVTCPFTLGGALPMWKQYWQMVLDPESGAMLTDSERANIQQRYQAYLRVIQEAAERENEQLNSTP
jgi:hypothetical protein